MESEEKPSVVPSILRERKKSAWPSDIDQMRNRVVTIQENVVLFYLSGSTQLPASCYRQHLIGYQIACGFCDRYRKFIHSEKTIKIWKKFSQCFRRYLLSKFKNVGIFFLTFVAFWVYLNFTKKDCISFALN